MSGSERYRDGPPVEGGEALKVVKSISLNEKTAPLAEAKANFSLWVRQALLDEAMLTRRKPDTQEATHVQPTRAEGGLLCWPFHEEGCCHLCWPEGPPTEADYSEWIASGTYTIHEARKVMTEEAPKGQGWLTLEEESALLLASKEENGPHTPPLRRRYVRRFLAWAWEWI